TPPDWEPQDAVLLLLAEGVLLDLELPEIDEAKEIRDRGRAAANARHRFEGRLVYKTIPDTAAARLYAVAPSETLAHAATLAPAIDGALLAQARASLGTWLHPSGPDGALRASDIFALGGARSASGVPLLANDTHLSTTSPAQ